MQSSGKWRSQGKRMNLQNNLLLDEDGMLVLFTGDSGGHQQISLLTLLDVRCSNNCKISEEQRQEALETLTRLRDVFEQGIFKIDREIAIYKTEPLDTIE